MEKRNGANVCYQSCGHRRFAKVKRGECYTYAPVESADQVNERDIVFCQVEPDDRFLFLVVTAKGFHPNRQEWRFTIANIRGYERGKCFLDKIYGRLISVHYWVQPGHPASSARPAPARPYALVAFRLHQPGLRRNFVFC